MMNRSIFLLVWCLSTVATARFVSADKLFIEKPEMCVDRPLECNLYGYANNNPIKHTDPTGEAIPLAAIAGYELYVGGAAATAYLSTPQGQKQLSNVYDAMATGVENAVSNIKSFFNAKSPAIDPKNVSGKTPEQIDQHAKDLGLKPQGKNPMAGQGSYTDPATGKQRILIHPKPKRGDPHSHVNNPEGKRLDIEGNEVKDESPEAHLDLDVSGGDTDAGFEVKVDNNI